MFLTHLQRRFTTWVALLSLVASGLLPTATQAMVAGGNRADWLEVCGVSGVLWAKADTGEVRDQLPDGSVPTSDANQHCLWCTLHGGAADLPVAPIDVDLPPRLTDLPPAFYRAPLVATVWAPAQSRAPLSPSEKPFRGTPVWRALCTAFSGGSMPSIPTFISSRRQSLVGLVAGGAWLLSGCDPHALGFYGGTSPFKGIDITGADYASGFQLTDFNGKTRSLSDFKGKVVMLYFGFVQCPDVCPTALSRAAAVMQQLGPQAPDLQVIFVTVDPERDTPELLREYMAAFHPSFLALTGSAEATQKTADEFRVHYKKVPTGSSYTMDHTALSYLFDRQGRIRVVLRHEQTADDYTADVRALLAQPA